MMEGRHKGKGLNEKEFWKGRIDNGGTRFERQQMQMWMN